MRYLMLVFALVLAAAPARAATVPAIAAFDEAFARVTDYSVLVHAHEVKGTQTQDRVYHYWFKKPHEAKTQIVSGPGAGGGGVWNGGDTVSGHQGGFLSFIHLKVGLHDGRAVSLRGYTIPDGLLQNQVDKYTEIKGRLTQRDGPTIAGQATDEVELRIADPSQYDGVTRAVLYLSKATHFPLRQLRYQADTVVTDETWTDLALNTGLKDSDFPF